MQTPVFQDANQRNAPPFKSSQAPEQKQQDFAKLHSLEAELVNFFRSFAPNIYNYDLRAVLSATRALDPNFNFETLDVAAVSFMDCSVIVRRIIRDIFISRGVIINLALDGNLQKGSIDPKSWKEMPALPGKPVWVAQVKLEDLGDSNSSLCLGDIALVDPAALERAGGLHWKLFSTLRQYPESKKNRSVESSLSQLESVVKSSAISEDLWIKSVYVPLGFWEEVQHARDGVRSADFVGVATMQAHPGEIAANLTLVGSEAQRALTLPEPNPVALYNVLELSARLAATIQVMTKLYALNKKELSIAAAYTFFAVSEVKELFTSSDDTLSSENYDCIGPLLRAALQQGTNMSKERLFERAEKIAIPAMRAKFLKEALLQTYRSQFIAHGDCLGA